MNTENKFKLIVGHLNYVDLETGFWEFTDNEEKYRISNVPDALKHENLHIAAMVEINENEMSVFMSGKSVRIIEYKIIK